MGKGKKHLPVAPPQRKKDLDTDGPAPKRDKQAKGRKKGKGCSSLRDDLEAELAAVGLRVKQITGDGNCFFRSLSDQLEGHETLHANLRQQVVDHLRANQEVFAPFVEDDESFGGYLNRIKKDGCWAGHLELVAASNLLLSNIHVHQSGQPRWVVGSHPEGGTYRSLHVSYHDGQHYNSVRNVDDLSTGVPPEPLVFRVATGDAGGGQDGWADAEAHAGVGGWGAREEQLVCRSCCCYDRSLVRKALIDVRGDVDAAIEKVIELLSNQVVVEEEEEVGEADAADEEDGGEALVSSSPTVVELQLISECAPSVAGGIPAEDCGGIGGECVTVAEAVNGQLVAVSVTLVATNGQLVGHDRETSDGVSPAMDSTGQDEQHIRDVPPGGGCAGMQSKAGRDSAECAEEAQVSEASGQEEQAASPATLCDTKAAAKPVRVKKSSLHANKKPPRNKPCPCGSGRKNKDCCGGGSLAAEKKQSATKANVDLTAKSLTSHLAAIHI